MNGLIYYSCQRSPAGILSLIFKAFETRGKYARHLLFIGFCLLTWHTINAQSIANVMATAQGDMVVIGYDLIAGEETNEFKIQVFASYNNYKEPIRFASGDIGERVTRGNNKTIAWAARSELANYKGNISFEVRGEPIIVIKPFSFGNPLNGSSVKRTKDLNIQWSGGGKNETVQLQLMQNSAVKGSVANTTNTGKYTWKVPKNTPKGTYQLSLNAPSGNTMSMPFKVKPKTGAFVKILPLLVVGGVVAALSGGGSGGDEPSGNKLPEAPKPN